MKTLHLWFMFSCCLWLFACSANTSTASDTKTPVSKLAVGSGDQLVSAANAPPPLPSLIAVDSSDPSWGDPYAPVTIVAFTDFECHFCAKTAATLEGLKEHYGPQRMRIVFKHFPLEFHRDAAKASVAGAAIYLRAGNAAFWAYYEALMLDRQGEESTESAMERGIARATEVAGASSREFLLGTEGAGRKVGLDMALGEVLRVDGTPTFFINGLRVDGAELPEVFMDHVDAELLAAKQALAQGVAPQALYAHQVEQALTKAARAEQEAEEAASAAADAAPVDPTVFRVPIDDSPSKGASDAPVTIVVFSDFQCPFCVKGSERMREIEKKYGRDVRFVFKHNPLPFHDKAIMAARLSEQIRVEKGEQAFFNAHDELFSFGANLEETALVRVARSAGLDPDKALAIAQGQKFQSQIWVDAELAEELKVTGTPTFFINGRRIEGALALAKFATVIDEERDKAKALLGKGTPAAKLYEELQKAAQASEPPEKREPGSAPFDSPSLGPKNAAVVVQVFTDFQCPFCKRHAERVAALRQVFPNDVRIVIRQLPLPMHKQARPAANLALEARSQKGDKGFFDMHDRIFEAQSSRLDEASLLEIAKDAGLDMKKVAVALAKQSHERIILRDEKRAGELKVRGTPGTFINNYFVSGAVPEAQLRRVVRQALIDKGRNPKPAPAVVTAPKSIPALSSPTKTIAL